ncbi:RHS repeat-associated core domain-containing protein [Pseudomonas sp. Root562]|uniref:RHS repeat-associated core domain-containing protein n=1 Tax=Pseudomonas sp. Root562 TaxID=1736561 RepID=UPI00070253D4|nr:RHS repeat-associated core domain-containing protein [Pseudomonas sp. Root562]KQZ81523.1 hypothetical protein ASD60_10065 [Pseudomonas sp. Root562]
MLSPQSCVLARYSYDPLDRLISHTRSTAPALRFYCENRLVTEIQGALRHSIVQHDDLLLAQQQHENEVFGTTLLATDLQRSVLHTLEKNTESQPIAYSAYGHRSAESGLTSRLGFNGERPDPMTGHYLLGNGYRAFNPALMRFNSPDSLSPFGKGGFNSYTYCLGDPINGRDPNGHWSLFRRTVEIDGMKLQVYRRATRREIANVIDETSRINESIQGKKYEINQIFRADKNEFLKKIPLKDLAKDVINTNPSVSTKELPPTLQTFLETKPASADFFELERGGTVDITRLGHLSLDAGDKRHLSDLTKNFLEKTSSLLKEISDLRTQKHRLQLSIGRFKL